MKGLGDFASFGKLTSQEQLIFRPQSFTVLLMMFEKSKGCFYLKETTCVLKDKTENMKLVVYDAENPGFADRSAFEVGCLVNSCNRGYGIFCQDDASIFFLERHLSDMFNYF